ncbi:MAG: hypothetical protein AAFS03_05670 [Pseudomonadota bacterium]
MTPRSIAIPKTWKTFNIASAFSAFGYPAIGVVTLIERSCSALRFPDFRCIGGICRLALA